MAINSYGLISVEKQVSVPLKSIHVDVSIKGIVVSMNAKLSYTNDEDNPIEAIFVLPLESGLSVCEFRAQIDGRTVVGKIEEKEQARLTYDDAISSGQTAFLMEESIDSDDIFKISVGNLPPKKSAEVIFTAVRVLKHLDDGEIQFVLPTILNPRYSPAEGSEQLDNWSQQSHTVPGVRCPYDFSMAAHIEAGSKITEITSPTHSLTVTKNDTSADVRLEKLEAFAKDVELIIKQEKPFEPVAFVESGDGGSGKGFMASDVIMVNYYPKDVLSKEKKMTPGEYIFIIDRSGSMSGSGIKNARESLILFLKSLPANSTFNIISFGSRFDFLFTDGSRPYTNASVSEACSVVSSMTANYGGTEILLPLQALFSQKASSDLQRRIFLITDGEVSNTSAVIDLVRQECASGKSRVFTLGIGHGASTSLIEGAARAGHGVAEFAREESTIQQKVISLVKTASRPFVADVTLKGEVIDISLCKQIPNSLPHTSLGQSIIFYILLNQHVSDVANKELKIQFSCGGNVTEHVIVLRMFSRQDHSGGQLVHRCAARRRLEELSICSDTEKEMTELSQLTKVLCKYTAFIGVDESSQEPIKGTMLQQNIPTLTSGYGGLWGNQGGMSFGAPASFQCFAPQAQPMIGGGGAFGMSMNAMPPPPPGAALFDCFGSANVDALSMPQQLGSKSSLFGGGPPPPPPPSLFSSQPMSQSSACGGPLFGSSSATPPPLPAKGEVADCALSPAMGFGSAPPPPLPLFSQEPVLPRMPGGPAPAGGSILGQDSAPKTKKSNVFGKRSSSPASDKDYMDIVTRQNVDGSWHFTEEVAAELHKSLGALRQLIPAFLRSHVNGEQIWATALVVVWLENHFQDRADELSLIVEKAWDWLEDEIQSISTKARLKKEAKNALML